MDARLIFNYSILLYMDTNQVKQLVEHICMYVWLACTYDVGMTVYIIPSKAEACRKCIELLLKVPLH